MPINPIYLRRIKILLSILAVSFVILHHLNFDNTTLILIAIAFSPLLFPLIKKIKLLGGTEILLHADEISEKNKKEIEKAASKSKVNITWDKVRTLFWFGNDLMFLERMIYTNASPQEIIHHINNLIIYAQNLGFESNSVPIDNLKNIKIGTGLLGGLFYDKTRSNEQITNLKHHYKGINHYIQNVKWYIDALAKPKQPDFKKLK